ncbi:Formyltransferase [Russula earlei]|uniref:Formyltransferase n=1 Tax=Russula earlei TaxID=71964 RepID=A0ACC0UGU2_9AGAM|nr:Formyltransferase [Russula earlei]
MVPVRSLARQYHNLRRFDILYFGRDEFSCQVFEKLYSATDVWQSLLIATQPDQMIGRKRNVLSVSPLKTLGNDLNVPVTTIPHVRSELEAWKPPSPFYPLAGEPPFNHLLLTASFGRILPSSLLSLFRLAHTLNVHPSALPAYRGPAPIQRAILNGERDTAVCVIEMKRRGGIDAGDVLGRVPISIPPGTGYSPLRDTLAQKGGDLLVSVLRSVLSGTETRVPQSSVTPATPRAPFITPVDSQPDFARETAEDVVRRHLALSHHKPLTTYLPASTRTVQIHDPSVFPYSTVGVRTVVGSRPGSAAYHKPLRSVLVRCAQESVLRVPTLKSEFRSLMPAKSWWDGIQPNWKDSHGCILFTNPPADHCV